MFTCPSREGAVFTGHRMRPAEFDSLKDSRSFRCSGCGEIHTWTIQTAWLQGRVQAVEPIA